MSFRTAFLIGSPGVPAPGVSILVAMSFHLLLVIRSACGAFLNLARFIMNPSRFVVNLNGFISMFSQRLTPFPVWFIMNLWNFKTG